MKSCIKRMALVALFMMASVPAMADAPDPDRLRRARNPDVTAHMHLSPDVRATEAKLIIPRSLLAQMSAQAGISNEQNSAATRLFNMTGAQTVVAGIFLSLAFASGGLWLVRSREAASRKPAARAALGVALLALCAASTGVAYANVGPPPVARSLTSRILIEDARPYGASGEVKVEVSNDARGITLVLPVPKGQ